MNIKLKRKPLVENVKQIRFRRYPTGFLKTKIFVLARIDPGSGFVYEMRWPLTDIEYIEKGENLCPESISAAPNLK